MTADGATSASDTATAVAVVNEAGVHDKAVVVDTLSANGLLDHRALSGGTTVNRGLLNDDDDDDGDDDCNRDRGDSAV